MVNPVAGAYAEQVPLLVVSGGPGEAEQQLAGVHHQAKDVEAQCRILPRSRAPRASCAHPELAARARSTRWCGRILAEHRPGYLEIHRDMVDLEIRVPAEILDVGRQLPAPDARIRASSREAVADTLARLRAREAADR